MRCLHCGKRLSLLRKFSDAEFCSDEHRLEFQQQQSDLALARLIEAQNQIKRPKPPAPPPSTKPARKPKAVEKDPGIPMARPVYEVLRPVAMAAVHVPALTTHPACASSDLPLSELSLPKKGFQTPGQLPLVAPLPLGVPAPRSAPGRALFRLSTALPARATQPVAPALQASLHLLALHGALARFAEPALGPHPVPQSLAAARPALPFARFQPDRIDAPPPAPLDVAPEAEPGFGASLALQLAPAALPPAAPLARPALLSLERVPAAPSLPACAGVLRAADLAALEAAYAVPARRRRTPPLQAAGAVSTLHLPALPPASPPQASLHRSQRPSRLKLKAVAAAAAVCSPHTRPALAEPRVAFPALALAATCPAPVAFGEQMLALDIQASAAAACPALPWFNGLLDAAREAAYPRTSLRTMPPEPPTPAQQPQALEPGLDVPPLWRELPVQPPRPAGCERGEPRWTGPLTALVALADPRMPRCRLVIDQADGSGPRHPRPEAAAKKRSFNFSFDARRLPGHKFWRHAPADLKWVALGLPLLLVLVVFSFRPSALKQEPAETRTASATRTVLGGQLNALQRAILSRAAVKLFDDFRGGLGSWSGEDGWSKSWKYGDASFLEPGQIALYTPSVGMRDYTFQFLGQIERKSLNWVFRAADARNYYSMRIVITRGGPLPEAQLIRSAVIGGKERDLKAMPIPFPVHPDTLYLVRMDLRGGDFTTYIQGQVVDTFSDSRLEQGGIGFYGGKGDRSRLRWVEVTHQYDFVGRLCALVAPYDMAAAQGKPAN